MQTIETTHKPNLKETEMQTNISPKFATKTAKIIAEIRNRTCIKIMDAQSLEEIFIDALNEYCTAVDEYYEEEYYIAIEDVRASAYDNGFADGYDVCYAENNS